VSEQGSLGLEEAGKSSGPVECLGEMFESDEARREHYLALLAEKLQDPEFRSTPGFPQGTDEDILRMSDPPYYTACPNPFLDDFVGAHGTPYDPQEDYSREPFAVDVSVGKTDNLYRAHGYHTKVPHLAIVPSILHYTNPGDLILDGFCGSGMSGVAAQWCGMAPREYRKQLEGKWREEGHAMPKWGTRRVVLGDLGPAATFIAANYNTPFDLHEFVESAMGILAAVEEEVGWMYETLHTDGKTRCRVNYTVWSEVRSCPDCSGEVVLLEEALEKTTQRFREEFPCPHCGTILTKRRLSILYEGKVDPALGAPQRLPLRRPVLINYNLGKTKFEKVPDDDDLAILGRIDSMPMSPTVPAQELPYMHMTHQRQRLETYGITHLHHFFLPRAAHALAALWGMADAVTDHRQRRMLLFFVEQAIWGISVLNRYKPIQFGRPGGSQVNNYMSGIYYVASAFSDCSPRYLLDGKLRRLLKAFDPMPSAREAACLTTGDCGSIPISGNSIDYIFTDPPFGENLYYADLNYLIESWHRVFTDAEPEAIIDKAKKKGTVEYQALMRRCFEEYHRVLKPGRWMTVVFSNSRNNIWRAIQEAMGTAGFVVADVRTLDKKQGSYRQVTSSAVKQDLVISAYKPTAALLEQFELGSATETSVWLFIDEHLSHVPVFVESEGQAEIVIERTPQMLHDRMIAFFVQRRVAVPIDGPSFFRRLEARYPKRDGMYFLQQQVSQFDRKRTSISELRQLTLFVSDEASAVQWVRQQLQLKPQPFQDLQPQFMQQLHSWAKHEMTVELRSLLDLNFVRYDGAGPVPDQIHGYLSTNFKDLRKLEDTDARLRTKATDRWYVPDSRKEGDLEKIRLRKLLKEFDDYRISTERKIKQFRTEAIRAGFKHSYDEQDYQSIVDVAAKLPELVIQEDEKLLMYYDVATMRLGD
jgi:hypothetical protein